MLLYFRLFSNAPFAVDHHAGRCQPGWPTSVLAIGLRRPALIAGQHDSPAAGEFTAVEKNGIVRMAGKSIIEMLLRGHKMTVGGFQRSSFFNAPFATKFY